MKVIQDVHDHDGKLLPPAPSENHIWSGETWVLDAQLQARNLANRLLALCADVDRAADGVRTSLSGDPLRALEHQLAADDAHAFLAAGAPSTAVPLAVQAWVTEQRTARQAAEDIVAKAQAFDELLLQVRALRLQAKENIRACADVEQARSARDQALESLRQLRAPGLE
ncbi:phage tail protein [Pseudomonas sp. UFMG81]|jgi:hypothetical protein|uniref:phage tail protein n=1 Tax=Pseudomonas sp. UFMG81 TaxID=2745936 RepID=UPI00188E99AF|nr:phage tail protein [Pseudomonas sp. UFMG81]